MLSTQFMTPEGRQRTNQRQVVAINRVRASRDSHRRTYSLLIHEGLALQEVEHLRELLGEQMDKSFEVVPLAGLDEVGSRALIAGAAAVLLHSSVSGQEMERVVNDCRRRTPWQAVSVLANRPTADETMRYLETGVSGCYDLAALEAVSQMMEIYSGDGNPKGIAV